MPLSWESEDWWVLRREVTQHHHPVYQAPSLVVCLEDGRLFSPEYFERHIDEITDRLFNAGYRAKGKKSK